jgi:pimeloyl-ACP methyl ester carboxylesterase
VDRRRAVAAAIVGLALLAGPAVLLLAAGDLSPVRPAALDEPALRVLHAWDAQRATAYARGAPERLRNLYVDGSAAGAADVRLLRAYRARGLRVTGMRTQVLAADVLARRPDLLRIRVTDRLDRAVALGGGGRVALPRDAASTRVLTLMRAGDGRWRVASVVDAP